MDVERFRAATQLSPEEAARWHEFAGAGHDAMAELIASTTSALSPVGLPALPVLELRGDEMAVITGGPWTDAVSVAPDKAILFDEDPSHVRFLHRCDRAHRGAGVIYCAPRLQIGAGHTIVQREPLTIVASILCPDCLTHGFVTDGRWVE